MDLPHLEANTARMPAGVPGLARILDVLDAQAIRYGLYAGSYVAIMTNRAGDFNDIDLLIADDDMDKVRRLFPAGLFKDKSYGQFFFPERSQTIECMAGATVTVPGYVYDFRLTKLAQDHISKRAIETTRICMLDPADTVLLKLMIMQKENGEPGRHDIEDVIALLDRVSIDRNYLMDRVRESHAETPDTLRLLRQLNLDKS